MYDLALLGNDLKRIAELFRHELRTAVLGKAKVFCYMTKLAAQKVETKRLNHFEVLEVPLSTSGHFDILLRISWGRPRCSAAGQSWQRTKRLNHERFASAVEAITVYLPITLELVLFIG